MYKAHTVISQRGEETILNQIDIVSIHLFFLRITIKILAKIAVNIK